VADHAEASSDPLPVSVIIPAYNREEMVVRAVKSALGQRPRPPAQVIVVDDCSADGTAAAAEAAGAYVVRHDVNRGEGGARNTGIKHAQEEWIGLLDSDDEWLPDMLATLWPWRRDHVLVGGASLNCAEGEQSCTYAGPLGSRPLLLDKPTAVMYPENAVAQSGTMVKRAVVEDVGGYAAELKGGADMDLWIRVLEQGTGLLVPKPVVLYHLHGGQVTTDVGMMADAHRGVARRYSDRPWFDPAILERWEGGASYDAAKRALSSGRPAEATRHIARLIGSPNRSLGAAGIVLRRMRLRRRSDLTDRNGQPTVAILPGATTQPAGARDLSTMSNGRALVRLAMRPTHGAMAGSWLQAIAARALGVREVSRDDRSVRG
jgi:glycosyltransferase involved in cell wall biosynthesis